jgi:hypothetical protein
MGTTLTGTTPQDTYDSLIKVTDNGPLSATGKYLSDGLGNDSILALSTAAVGVGTATPSYKLDVDVSVNGDWATRIKNNSATGYGLYVEGSENSGQYLLGLNNGLAYKMVVQGDGNVGIGTSTPAFKLDVVGDIKANVNAASANGNGLVLRNQGGGGGESVGLVLSAQNQQENSQIRSTRIASSLAEDIQFFTGTNNVSTEKVRILAGGGLTFNGDTAAANALDDYEEGTWTMGVSFGGGTTGITYTSSTGGYTKIGRQVTVTGFLVLTSKGSSTGSARITGLPFTIAGAASNYSAPILYFENISFANQFQGFGVNGETSIALYETTEAGTLSTLNDADFSNSSAIIISFTYFV